MTFKSVTNGSLHVKKMHFLASTHAQKPLEGFKQTTNSFPLDWILKTFYSIFGSISDLFLRSIIDKISVSTFQSHLKTDVTQHDQTDLKKGKHQIKAAF